MAAQKLSREHFDSGYVQSQQLALVQLVADYYTPNPRLDKIIDEVAEQFYDSVLVGRLDIENCLDLAAALGILTVPAVLIFKNGEIVERMVGEYPRQAYIDAINLRRYVY